MPADGRLLSETGLEIDESLLTGESLPVDKDARVARRSADRPLADRLNMVYAGTIVVRGRAKAVVTATGPGSCVGQLAIDVWRRSPGRPPLLDRAGSIRHG